MSPINNRIINLLWKKFNNLGDSNPQNTIATESLKYNDFNFIESLLNHHVPDKIIVTQTDNLIIETHLNNNLTRTPISNILTYLDSDYSISIRKLKSLFQYHDISAGSYMHLNQLNRNYKYLIFHYRLELSLLNIRTTFSWWSTEPSNIFLNEFDEDDNKNYLKNTIPRKYDTSISRTYDFVLEYYQDNSNNFNTDICVNKFFPLFYSVSSPTLDNWIMDPNTGYIMFLNDPLINITTRNIWNTNTKSPPFFSFISYDGDTGFNNIDLSGTITVSGGLYLNNEPLFEHGASTGGIITNSVNTFYGTQDINLKFIYNFNTRFPIYANIKYTNDNDGTQTIAITTDKFNYFYNKNIQTYFNDNINDNINNNNNNNLFISIFRQYLFDLSSTDNIQFLTHETDSITSYGTGKYDLTKNDFFQDISDIFIKGVLGDSSDALGDKFYVFLWNDSIVDLSLQQSDLNYNNSYEADTTYITIKNIINAVAPVMQSFFISNLIQKGFRVNDSSINSIREQDEIISEIELTSSINMFTAPYMIDLSSNNDFSMNGGILINIGLRSLMIDTNKNYLMYGIYIYDFKDDGTPYNDESGYPDVELIHFTVNANTVSFLNKFYSDRIYIDYQKLNDYWLEEKSRPIGYKFGIDLRIFIGGPMSNNNIELRNFNISFTNISH